MKIIPYGRQYIDHKDIKSVSRVLNGELITTGSQVDKFENKIKNFLNCKYSLSCNSGTSALFLAFKSIDIKKNDIIIMPAINFVASYNIAKQLNAKIYLADVDKETGQMLPRNGIDVFKKYKIKR